MDVIFGNDLGQAAEDEEDVNQLNDLTFGETSVVYDEDWEEQHEKLAEVLEQSGGGIGIVSAFPSSFHPHLSDYDDEAQLEMHESDLQNTLSQLVVDDDEDEDQSCLSRQKKRAINLDELFGPSSPPGFPSTDLLTGHPSIWGSPARESHMPRSSVGLQNFFKSLQMKQNGGPSRIYQLEEVRGRADGDTCLPENAKTLEEIEGELIRTSTDRKPDIVTAHKQPLTVEELERQLLNDIPPKPAVDPSVIAQQRQNGSPAMVPSEVTDPHIMERLRMSMPHGGDGMMNPALMPPRMVRGVLRHPIPMPGYGRGSPYMFGPHRPLIYPPFHPGPDGRMPMPPRFMMHPNHPNLPRMPMPGYGLPFGMHPHPMMPPMDPLHPMHHLQHQNVPHRPQQPQPNHSPRQPLMNSRGAFPLQMQQRFQQQQMHQLMRTGYMEHHQILPRLGYNSQMADDDDYEFNTENPDDEYAGLMTQREKDWIIKIQLMQLHTDNPYVDDFYYTSWSMKKMVRENQQKRRDGGIVNRSDPNSADNDPVLLLPQLAKSDKLIYTPSEEDYEGSLGRLTASSIHNPRQIIDVHLSTGVDPDELHKWESKKFKESLLQIEKSYDTFLVIDDIEKKALAQPPENRQTFFKERQNLIYNLYQNLVCSSEFKDGLSQLLSVHKGAMLVARLLPMLERKDARTFAGSILNKLSLLSRKDWQDDHLMPTIYRSIRHVVETADLEALVTLADSLTHDLTQNNLLNHLMSTIQYRLGLSVILCLLSRSEVIYTTQSPLDMDADHQRQWQQFVEDVAASFENLDKDMFSHPLEQFANVADHFGRFLDKRWLLVVEDKLETICISLSKAEST